MRLRPRRLSLLASATKQSGSAAQPELGVPRRRRIVFAVCGAIAGASAGGVDALVAAPLLGVLGWRVAALAHDRQCRKRERLIDEALPDALDLLVVCTLAGLSVERGFRMIAEEATGPLGESMRAAVSAWDVGLGRDAVYTRLGGAHGSPGLAALVTVLRRAQRYGAPLAETLAAHAADARDRAGSAQRERALSAPVRMLFPLTLCFLPAFVLLAIAPSVLVAFEAFRG